ncbi:MAG: PEP/pyruvate-binding domain-containing protein [Thermomicrobiales bacterium]
MAQDSELVVWYEDLDIDDVASVGGKNASLGEMIGALASQGIRVPAGFATTAEAYRMFIDRAGIRDEIAGLLEELSTDARPLDEVGERIRRLILESEIPDELATSIREAYRDLSSRSDVENVDVAVRSSATAEDLPDASFAGQQETYLNVRGEDQLLEACRKCIARYLPTGRSATGKRTASMT